MASRRVLRGRNFGSYIAALNQDVSLLSTRPVGASIAGNVVGSSELSSNISLDNNTLQSSNYVPGYYGWKIDSSGLAEFGNVYVRGDINARTGTIGYWHISTPTVERTIGNRQLFGTFLESNDIGYSDNGKTSGSYVSLFKSYDEPAVSITNKYRKDNIATITAPEHGFQNADHVTINVDGDISFSTGESSIQIFSVTRDTFSYLNTGADFLNADSTGAELDTSASGTAQLYIKDVSGLYLQDYGKALFDYGYFSNEGVAYVSAETPNLVYNSSFEYANGGTYQYSSNSWIPGTSSISAYSYASEDKYAGDSFWGGQIGWTNTALSTYLHATVNELDFKRLDFYKNNRELYLNFDMFFKFPISKVAIPTTNSFVTTSSSIITITCPGHGLAVDDLVYLDFSVSATGYYDYTSGYRIHTVLSVSGDSFTIENKYGTTTSNPVTLSRRYTISGPVIFKYTQPVFDLNEIKISFVTGYDVDNNPILDSTTSLYDVLTDTTIANWSDYRYWSHSAAEFETWYLGHELYSPGAYRPISSMGITIVGSVDGSTKQLINIKISSSKLESFYRSISQNSYNFDTEFYLSFPEWMWEGTYSDGGTATTKRNIKVISSANTGYILDNISISPNKKFFFGDSGSSSFYYKPTTLDPDLVTKTNKVSYEAPRQWLDIDLDYQTAQLKYMDSIEFKSSDFLKQLYINPNINTVKTSATIFGLGNQERALIGESSALNISSGQYKYLLADGVNYRTVESISNQETTISSAVYKINAKSSTYDPRKFDGLSGATIQVSVDSQDAGDIYGWADTIRFAGNSSIFLGSNNGTNLNYSNLLMTGDGLVSLDSTLNTVRFQMDGASGAGFRQNSNNSFVFGLTNDTTSKISAFAIQNNELTSNYQAVYISNTDNTLGYVSSSIETKKNIEPLGLSIDNILAAEPIKFNYKSEKDGSPKHAGFIAEQLVESGLGGYVSFDAEGRPKTVNYEMFVSALQSVVRHQASQLTDLTSRLEALEGK